MIPPQEAEESRIDESEAEINGGQSVEELTREGKITLGLFFLVTGLLCHTKVSTPIEVDLANWGVLL